MCELDTNYYSFARMLSKNIKHTKLYPEVGEDNGAGHATNVIKIYLNADCSQLINSCDFSLLVKASRRGLVAYAQKTKETTTWLLLFEYYRYRWPCFIPDNFT